MREKLRTGRAVKKKKRFPFNGKSTRCQLDAFRSKAFREAGRNARRRDAKGGVGSLSLLLLSS